VDRKEQDQALQEREMARLRNLLATVIWMLDMCDRPPAVPSIIAPQIDAELQEARRQARSPVPSWSCYAKDST